jgi:hypothetical protein
MKAKDYVHRIGRTGRAGRNGLAVTLAERMDAGMIRRIQHFTTQDIPVATVAGLEPKMPAPKLFAPRPQGGFGGKPQGAPKRSGKPFGARRDAGPFDRAPAGGQREGFAPRPGGKPAPAGARTGFKPQRQRSSFSRLCKKGLHQQALLLSKKKSPASVAGCRAGKRTGDGAAYGRMVIWFFTDFTPLTFFAMSSATERSVSFFAKPDSITVPFSVSTLMAPASTCLLSIILAFTWVVIVASST